MAAVLCLVCLPLVAAVGFMTGAVLGDRSPASMLGGAAFIALAVTILAGAVQLARGWDAQHGDEH